LLSSFTLLLPFSFLITAWRHQSQVLKQKPQNPTENVKGTTNGKSSKFILPLPVSLPHVALFYLQTIRFYARKGQAAPKGISIKKTMAFYQ